MSEVMWEIGRECEDGSVVGGVFPMCGNLKRVGSFRIEGDGTISRFPGTTAQQRRKAHDLALERYKSLYGGRY